MKKNILKKSYDQKGFSLIEISIAILVIGIILSFGIKGFKMIENANVSSIANQLNQYTMAVKMFEESNGKLPGINQDNFNEETFWQDLQKENLISGEIIKNHATTKLNGIISAIFKNGHIILKLTDANGNGVLTPKQVYFIDKKIDTGIPNFGHLKPFGEKCIQDNKYDTNCNEKCCGIEFEI